jgi:hypothetical protein
MAACDLEKLRITTDYLRGWSREEMNHCECALIKHPAFYFKNRVEWHLRWRVTGYFSSRYSKNAKLILTKSPMCFSNMYSMPDMKVYPSAGAAPYRAAAPHRTAAPPRAAAAPHRASAPPRAAAAYRAAASQLQPLSYLEQLRPSFP